MPKKVGEIKNNMNKMYIRKPNKISNNWESKISKRYKRNTITTDLHCAQKILSNFESEIKVIENEYMKAKYPFPFFKSVINYFKTPKDEPIVPKFLFNKKLAIFVKIPFCDKNEKYI